MALAAFSIPLILKPGRVKSRMKVHGTYVHIELPPRRCIQVPRTLRRSPLLQRPVRTGEHGITPGLLVGVLRRNFTHERLVDLDAQSGS